MTRCDRNMPHGYTPQHELGLNPWDRPIDGPYSENPTPPMLEIIEEERTGRMDPLRVQVGGGHYKSMHIQPVEFITKNQIPFIEGCVIKYVCRHAEKGGRQDLEKAKHFIDLLLDMRYSGK